MRKILFILSLIFICFLSKAQSNGDPAMFPTVNSAPYYKFNGFAQIGDGKALILPTTDTNWHPRFSGTTIYKSSDSSIYWWTGNIWVKASGGGGGSQSWNDVMVVSPDFLASHTSNFHGFNWEIDSANEFKINSGDVSFAGAASQLLLSPSEFSVYIQQNSTDGWSQISNGITQVSLDAGNITNNTTANLTLNSDGTGSIKTNLDSISSTAPNLIGIDIDGNWHRYSYTSSGGTVFDTTTRWSVLDSLNTPPVSPTTGDIYEVGTVPTGAWVGHAGDIATYNGATWDFEDANTGDLLYNVANDLVSKWTGSVWVRVGKLAHHQGGDRFAAPVIMGSLDLQPLNIRTNNVVRIRINATGAIQFNNAYTFPTSDGTANQVLATNGSGQLSFTSATGLATWQNTLDATNGQVLTTDHTITATGLAWTWNTARWTLNASDSVHIGTTNDFGVASLGTARILAATITAKASTATFGSNTKSIYHYETGTSDSIALELKSVGARWVGITTLSPSAADKPLQMDTVTGLMQRKLIDVSNNTAQITGVGNVANGMTGQSSYTDGQLLIGNTSGNTLTKATLTAGSGITVTNGNGSITIASSLTSPWTRGVLPSASATTNIIYPTTQTDSVFIGPTAGGISANKPKALFDVNGTAQIEGILTTGANATIGGKVGIQGSTAAGTAGITSGGWGTAFGITMTGSASESTNANLIGVNINPNSTNASTASTATITGFKSNITQSTGVFANTYGGFEATIAVNSTSGTNTLTSFGFKNSITHSGSGTEKITTAYGYWDLGVTGTTAHIGTVIYQYIADSFNSVTYTGASAWGFYQRKNTANTIYNYFGGLTQVGGADGTQSTAGLLTLGAGTSTLAQIVLPTSTTVSSPTAGMLYHVTPQLLFVNGGGQAQELFQGQQTRVSSQFDKTNETLADITGLTATLVAGKKYRFEANLYTTSDVAGGVKAAIAGTATATAIVYEGLTYNAGLITQSRATALATAVGAVTAVTAAYVHIEGTITVNAAGTLTVQSARNAATGTTSVLVGSTFVVTEIL